MKPKISVIIPVYNVEVYLAKALDSVINQTYDNLEIIVIDDGSNDGSGKICDAYTKLDDRITVFHTENRGLSIARNIGLDHCTGDYIAFLDGDDWMESEAIEYLLKSILSVDADVAVCNYIYEYPDHQIEIQYPPSYTQNILLGKNIIREHLNGHGICTSVWNKLYKSSLFADIRFPESRLYEDIATTYRVLVKSNKLVRLQKPLIHYRQRSSGITKTHSLNNLKDYWLANFERFKVLVSDYPECRVPLLSGCIDAIGRLWRWYYVCPGEVNIEELQFFAREHEDEVLKDKRYSKKIRISCILARCSNPLFFWLLYHVNQIYRRFHNKKCFE